MRRCGIAPRLLTACRSLPAACRRAGRYANRAFRPRMVQKYAAHVAHCTASSRCMVAWCLAAKTTPAQPASAHAGSRQLGLLSPQEFVVHPLLHDEALGACAVLAARLEGAAQRGGQHLRWGVGCGAWGVRAVTAARGSHARAQLPAPRRAGTPLAVCPGRQPRCSLPGRRLLGCPTGRRKCSGHGCQTRRVATARPRAQQPSSR